MTAPSNFSALSLNLSLDGSGLSIPGLESGFSPALSRPGEGFFQLFQGQLQNQAPESGDMQQWYSLLQQQSSAQNSPLSGLEDGSVLPSSLLQEGKGLPQLNERLNALQDESDEIYQQAMAMLAMLSEPQADGSPDMEAIRSNLEQMPLSLRQAVNQAINLRREQAGGEFAKDGDSLQALVADMDAAGDEAVADVVEQVMNFRQTMAQSTPAANLENFQTAMAALLEGRNARGGLTSGNAAGSEAMSAAAAAAASAAAAQSSTQSANAATPPTITVPVGEAGWGDELADRMQWMVGRNIQSAEIKVTPANLGPVEMKISMNNDQASVTLVSQHAPVREAMEAALPRLREMFADQGINQLNVNVSGQNASGQQQERQGQQADESDGTVWAGDVDAEADEESGDNGDASVRVVSSERPGVDYYA